MVSLQEQQESLGLKFEGLEDSDDEQQDKELTALKQHMQVEGNHEGKGLCDDMLCAAQKKK